MIRGKIKADGIICIDVLEHSENSSEIFIKEIHPLLKEGCKNLFRFLNKILRYNYYENRFLY